MEEPARTAKKPVHCEDIKCYLPVGSSLLLPRPQGRGVVSQAGHAIFQTPCLAPRIYKKFPPPSAFHLIALTFIRSYVATARVLLIGTRPAALVTLKQMTLTVSAAARVARINRRAAREKSLRLCRAAVVT